MDFFRKFSEKCVMIWNKCAPVFTVIGNIFRGIGRVFSLLGKYVFKLRGIFMAIPVAVIAVISAMINMERLPDTLEYAMLGIDFDATQTLFGPVVMNVEQISREMAVMGPLTLTAICLLFTVFSKRTLFPWIISIFTLLIPTLLYLTTQYPA
jgi:hypothetical protein